MSSLKNEKDIGFHRKSVHKSVYPRQSQSSSNFNMKGHSDLKPLPLLKGTYIPVLNILFWRFS